MRGRKTSLRITLSPDERAELERRLRCTTCPAGLVRRSRVILAVAEGLPLLEVSRRVQMTEKHVRNGPIASSSPAWRDYSIGPDAAASRSFPPSIALHAVKIACERPDRVGRSLAQWDCVEIARQLQRDGVVSKISSETVRKILHHHRLKPWRQKMWLSAKVPRDATFATQVQEISDLYTRRLRNAEVVLCVDEMTSLQPRPRATPTLPTRPNQPTRVEHEYGRCGALNLFAAFDTRTGKVYGQTASRKRQTEFISFLEHLEREIPEKIKKIHVVLDNLRMHKGKQVQAWLAKHRRFVFHHPPVHCSWMNQVEQWFGILRRKRLRIADFADKQELAERLMNFIGEWNENAHPFNWTTKSVTKIMAKCKMAEDQPLARAA
jgi:transposase